MQVRGIPIGILISCFPMPVRPKGYPEYPSIPLCCAKGKRSRALPNFRLLRPMKHRDGQLGISSCFNGFIHAVRSEEHTSELQSLMRISYAVFCLKKTTYTNKYHTSQIQ